MWCISVCVVYKCACDGVYVREGVRGSTYVDINSCAGNTPLEVGGPHRRHAGMAATISLESH